MMAIAPLLIGFVLSADPSTLTMPRADRPAWLREKGIVMAGSWEPLIFRVRRDGRDGYDATQEEREAYAREHSREMVGALRALGVNFVMMHAYKGFGMAAEAESMRDAARFAALCREEGLRTGCYTFSGTIGWELARKEIPGWEEWVQRDPRGRPVPYGSMTFRHYIDRMHPDAAAYLKRIVRFAVEEMKVDLLHFDNYAVGPGYGANASVLFRTYLADRYGAAGIRARFGVDAAGAIDTIAPPSPVDRGAPVGRDYLRFSCRWLTESYLDLGRFARSLRPGILLECNPGGIGAGIHPPVDHATLLRGGEAFWDEGAAPGWDGKAIHSRIRTYKVGRRLGNMAFAYTTNPLEAAESIAFNLDCLGCIVWFEYGRLVEKPGSSKPVSPSLAPYIDLFRKIQPEWGGREVIADVAILRSFPSLVLAPPEAAACEYRAEQALIEGHAPFAIISERELASPDGVRAIVLAGCPALADADLTAILAFARRGRGLVIAGPAGILDEDLRPRADSPIEAWTGKAMRGEAWRIERDGARIAYLPESAAEAGALVEAARWAAGGRFTIEVEAPPSVACEFVRHEGGAIGIHTVHYGSGSASGLRVRARGLAGAPAARWISPGADPKPLSVRRTPRSVRGMKGSRVGEEGPSGDILIELPDLEVYGLLSIHEEGRP